MGKERKGHENVDPDFIAAGRGERDVILGEKKGKHTIWSQPESKKLFKLWKEDKRIPERFNSWEEINAEIAAIKKKHPKIDRDVLMDKLGWSEEYTHRHNVLGNSFMNKDGLIARNIRDDINIVSEKLIHAAGEKIYGKGNGHVAVAEYRAQVKENWFSLRTEEQQALREYFGTEAFKKKAFAKGHNFASLMGGDASLHNIKLQVGDLNTALKSNPRFAEILMKEWDVPTSSAQSYFNNIASSDYTVPRGILQVMSESGWIKPEALRLAESQLQSLDKQGITYNALDIFDAVDPDTGGLDVNRVGQFPEQAVTKDVPQAQKIANLQSTTKNPQILDVIDTKTGETVLPDLHQQVEDLKTGFLESNGGTNFNSHKKTNPLLVERNIDPLTKLSRIASKLPKPPKIPAWAKVGTAATLYGLYGDVTQAAETSQEVQEEGWGPRQVMEATSAITGLASLIPPLAPVTAPISLVTGVTGAAMGRREDQQELRQDQLENPQNYRWNKDNTKFERIPEPSYNDPGPLTIEPTQTATQVINQQRLDLIESGKLKAEGDDPISRTVSDAVDWLTNWYKKKEN